jgi:2-polyprenyl-6-methoxyphenol hydroxylase-like FAD-dependent oxidoreductase
MNTGIQDAMALAEALATALTSGNEEPLNAYNTIGYASRKFGRTARSRGDSAKESPPTAPGA